MIWTLIHMGFDRYIALELHEKTKTCENNPCITFQRPQLAPQAHAAQRWRRHLER